MVTLILCACLGQASSGSEARSGSPQVRVTGPWMVTVGPGELTVAGRKIVLEEAVEVAILPAASVKITDEKHDALPLYNAVGTGGSPGSRHHQRDHRSRHTGPRIGGGQEGSRQRRGMDGRPRL